MQEELPQDFLAKMAREYNLTSLEEEAFIETFSSERTDQVIIKVLNLTLSAYRARMGNVYAKFSFRDGGRGKKLRLHYFLYEKYRKENPNRPIQFSETNIDSFVDELNERLRAKIHNECSSMRVLDMTRPLELSSIFTEVNVLEQVSRNQRLRIEDLLRDFQTGDNGNSLDRFGLSHRTAKTVSGLDYVQQQDKLLIIGKPGAGKTTFLKHLAIQCSDRKLFANYLPIFVVLKDFAEKEGAPSLLEYVIQEHDSWKVHSYEIDYLLQERRILLLLDGLDEVKIEDIRRVNQQIQSFTENFHGNRFVLTCRVAAQEYVFEQFTEVEVADFNEQQIEAFSHNWFIYKQTPEKADRFLEKLQQNLRIQELATNPLLLTLLCLVFEEEADFPASRAELYEEGINTLLRRWDASRNIERDQLYQELSVARKIGMLSHIALKAFEQSAIFFKKQTLASYIADYIVNLPDKRRRLRLMPYEIEQQGESVLQSIAAQHGLFVERAYGIYSFSHLSFQEYFAAKAISSEYELERLQLVFEQVRNKQWNEVFLLAVNMSSRADGLVKLMKLKTDEMLLAQPHLVRFLVWLNHKALQIYQVLQESVKRPLYFVRAFYFIYSFSREDVISPLNSMPTHPEMDLDRSLITVLNTLVRASHLPVSSPELPKLLKKLEVELQAVNRIVQLTTFSGKEAFQRGWQPILEALQQLLQRDIHESWLADLQGFVQQLRSHLITHRDIGHDWNFDESEITTLKEYYNANQLLLDCLNSDCYVSRQLQKQIKDMLFGVEGTIASQVVNGR